MGEGSWRELLDEQECEIYRHAGYPRLAGLGQDPALLIIDVEYRMTGDIDEAILDSIAKYRTSCGPSAWQVVPRIRLLLATAREIGIPVVFTRATSSPDIADLPRPGNEVIDDLAPQPGELIISKETPSAFFGTPLARSLIRSQVDTLIHVGGTTSGCVRASVADAAAYGFKNLVVEDCVFDRWKLPHQASLFSMNAQLGEVKPLEDALAYLRTVEGGLRVGARQRDDSAGAEEP